MRKSVVFAVLSIFVLLLSSCGAENNVDLISFIEEEKEMVEMNDMENLLVYEITGKKKVGDDESDLMCELKISSQSSKPSSSARNPRS